ncbi:hypothetical protein BGU93_18710, partial [Clostridioides difficile]
TSEEMIRKHWNDTSVTGRQNRDSTRGEQCVRGGGSWWRVGEGYAGRVCQLCYSSYTLEEMRARKPMCKSDLSRLYQKPPKTQGKHTLEEAKELYPEWYQ